MEDGDGADGRVEVCGEEVPEEFWPEEGEDGGGGLVCLELPVSQSVGRSVDGWV